MRSIRVQRLLKRVKGRRNVYLHFNVFGGWSIGRNDS
jgi:hypothetical protein